MTDFTELRVHGVSGTPPRDMLYTDPIGRDPAAGSPRSYTTVYSKPSRDSDVAVEAFHWGGLTAGSWRTAFWILLAPFAFANISGWMAARKSRAGQAGVRAAGLALTVLFVSQLAVVLIDMPYHWLSSRLDGVWIRFAMLALFLVFGFLYFLLVQKASAQSHFPPALSSERQLELLLATDPQTLLPEGHKDDDSQWEDPAGATLADPVVWERHAIVHRLRRVHLAAGLLVVALTAARGVGSAPMEGTIVGLMALTVITLVATTFAAKTKWVRVATAWAPALAIAAAGWSLIVMWLSPLPASDHWTGVHETTFQIALFMFISGVFILFSGLSPLGAFAVGAQLGGAFGIAVAVAAESIVGVDEVKDQGAGWAAVAMLFLTVILVFLAGRLARPWDGSGLDPSPEDPDQGRSRRLMTVLRRVTIDARAVFKVAAVFAIVAGGLAYFFGCVGETACSPFNLGQPPGPALIGAIALLALALIWWTAQRIVGWIAILVPMSAGVLLLALDLGFLDISILRVDLDLTTLVGVSIAVTVLLPGSFIVTSLVGGFRDAERRRKVGILWDVASFFPRWYHPLAPPAYGPYVVQKLKEELAEHPRDVLSAHSQGAMIALVTLGQRDTVAPRAFLTYGCQLGAHYPSHFPTAGIPELVETVREKLGPGRWISLWRPNDPLGGPVGGTVLDREVDEAVGHSRYEVTRSYDTARRDLL